MKVNELSDKELLINLINTERKLYKILNELIDFEYYPGQLMGLGDFWIEKQLLLEELIRRRQNESKE